MPGGPWQSHDSDCDNRDSLSCPRLTSQLPNFIAVLLIALSQQLELPAPPRGFGTSVADVVVDAAGVLTQAGIERLNRIAHEVHAKTGGEIALVTLPDLRGRDVAEVALRIGREWGIGSDAGVASRERNAGAVVLIVPKETAADGRGHVRIETGRGVEGFITDGTAGDIQRAAIPLLQRQDYDGAARLIVSALADRFAAEFGVSLDPSVVPEEVQPSRPGRQVAPPVEVLFFFLAVAFLILSGLGRARGRLGGGNGCLTLLWAMSMASHGRRHRGGWGGGGFGGGSFGGGGGFGGFGGGGGFSGGGSSGSW